MKKIIIIGGGISGLVTAIQLARNGAAPVLIERKSYPFHRVCGEYVSNEATPFLKQLQLYPDRFSPPVISRFELSSITGKSGTIDLDLGGFGISRYVFDQFLSQHAVQSGVRLITGQAEQIRFSNDAFTVETSTETLSADLVIGSFGKRSVLDVSLGRDFIGRRSPYVGVKYHIRTNHPPDLISLHNFSGGYCGISRIEEGKYNLCYLTSRANLKKCGSIPALEETILYRNPLLKKIFTESEFLVDKPETIGEISFETKMPVEKHVLMTGDAAGMITPLCGNGMAMALHSSKLLAEFASRYCHDASYSREKLERDYTLAWEHQFKPRLRAGRHLQRLFGGNWTSHLSAGLVRNMKPLARWLVSKTHGKPF